MEACYSEIILSTKFSYVLPLKMWKFQIKVKNKFKLNLAMSQTITVKYLFLHSTVPSRLLIIDEKYVYPDHSFKPSRKTDPF